jgi:hypothetical protein
MSIPISVAVPMSRDSSRAAWKPAKPAPTITTLLFLCGSAIRFLRQLPSALAAVCTVVQGSSGGDLLASTLARLGGPARP